MTRHTSLATCLAAGGLFALTFALPAQAAQQKVTLDPEQTHIEFSVDATGHDVHGSFHLQEGAIRFDPATGAASGEIRIDARKAETGSASRDKKMHKTVLESDQHPLFVFRAERLEGTVPSAGEGPVQLIGQLAIHGAEHPMTLPATVRVDGDQIAVETTFLVPYAEWGMHNPSLLFLRVADEVSVTVVSQGSLAPMAEPAGGTSSSAANDLGQEP
jgi:polyisoprenoid-binding protein YceI